MQSFRLPKGSLRAKIEANAIAYIASLPDTKSWRIEIKQDVNSRSIQQCRYLNGVAYRILSDATGYERDDISEYMNGCYFGLKEKKLPGNRVTQVPVRTTTTDENGERSVLDKLAFAEYVAFVQRFAAEKGVHIPDPE